MSIHDLKNALQFVIGQRESGEYPGPAVAWGCMSAKPVRVEDPDDPEVILRDLPVRERAEFLRQYREAVDVAHDPPGYGRLQRLLHVWRLTVIAIGRVGYYEELAAGAQRHGPDEASRGSLPGLAAAAGGGADSGTVTYQVDP
jgi:hypothetical protein